MFFKGSLLLKLSVDNLNCSTRFETSAERKILQKWDFPWVYLLSPSGVGEDIVIWLFVIYILLARKLLCALCFGSVCLCTNCVHYALMHYALLQYACAAHGLRCRCRPCVHCPTRCFLLSLTKQQLELLPLQRCGKDRKPCQCPYSCHTLATTKVIPPDLDKEFFLSKHNAFRKIALRELHSYTLKGAE